MKKILMVCLGNICRSPVAEGILKHKLEQHGIEAYVDSAGTSGWHNGEQPDARSMANAKKNGVDISDQQSRQVGEDDFEAFDLIYAMDNANYSNLINIAPEEHHHKIKMILNEVYPGEDRPVPDPYYGDDGFQLVFDLVNQACDKIVEQLK